VARALAHLAAAAAAAAADDQIDVMIDELYNVWQGQSISSYLSKIHCLVA
jgi:hypothetical protein